MGIAGYRRRSLKSWLLSLDLHSVLSGRQKGLPRHQTSCNWDSLVFPMEHLNSPGSRQSYPSHYCNPHVYTPKSLKLIYISWFSGRTSASKLFTKPTRFHESVRPTSKSRSRSRATSPNSSSISQRILRWMRRENSESRQDTMCTSTSYAAVQSMNEIELTMNTVYIIVSSKNVM